MIGRFTFTGSYDDAGSVAMVKQYAGLHQVVYRGAYDGEGSILGRWSIGDYWSGPFVLARSAARHREMCSLRPPKWTSPCCSKPSSNGRMPAMLRLILTTYLAFMTSAGPAVCCCLAVPGKRLPGPEVRGGKWLLQTGPGRLRETPAADDAVPVSEYDRRLLPAVADHRRQERSS